MSIKLIIFSGAIFVMACNNNDSKDAVQKADSANISKIDSNAVSNGKAAIAVDKAGADFLVKAMEGGMMEVDLGNIAKEKSTNPRIKQFGKMMVEEHGAGGAKIKNLATVRNVTLPTMTGDEKSKMIRDLNEKKGNDFNKAYIDGMVKDHKEDIKEFQDASNKVNDTEIKAFISETLPMLRRHLDSCTAIQADMKKNH